MVEPAILKAVQGVEQRHVEKANHLPNGIDGEQAYNHTLEKNTTILLKKETFVHFHLFL